MSKHNVAVLELVRRRASDVDDLIQYFGPIDKVGAEFFQFNLVKRGSIDIEIYLQQAVFVIVIV